MTRPPSKTGPTTRNLAAAAIVLALLPGCFTVHLWGLSLEDEDQDGSYSIVGGVDGPPFMKALPVRLLLTPLAVVLDLCTSPVQAYLYGWDESDGVARRDADGGQ